MFLSLFAHRALCEEEIYADILNEKGLNLERLIGDNFQKAKDFVVKDIKADYPLRQLVLDALNFDSDPSEKTTPEDLQNVYKEIRPYVDNTTVIDDILPKEAWTEGHIKLVAYAFPHFAPFLESKGYNTTGIQKCIDSIKENKGQCQYKDVFTLLQLPVEFYWNVTGHIKSIMTEDSFKEKDIAPVLLLNESYITNLTKDVPSYFNKGHVNIAEMSTVAYNAINFVQGFYGSSKVFLGKIINAFLKPYVTIFPQTKKQMRKDAEAFVNGYDSLVKDKNFTEKELETVTKYIVNIYNDLKRQLNDEVILVPQDVKTFFLRNLNRFDPHASILSLVLDKKITFFDAFINGNKDLIKPFLEYISVDDVKLNEWYEKVSAAVKKYYDENTPIPGFQLDWVEDLGELHEMVKDYPSTTKINDILAEQGINKMNPEIVKYALLNVSKIFEEFVFEDHFTRTISTILKKMASVTKDDVTIGDYVKCLPFGESLAMYYHGLDLINQNKTIKDAFWDWTFEGIYPMRTFEAWKSVQVPSIQNLIKAIVTYNETGVKFVTNALNLYTKLIKNEVSITRNEINQIMGGFVERILNYTVPIAELNNYNVSAYFYKYTGVNISGFAVALQKIVKEASTGSISWDKFVEFNKELDEEFYQPISAEFDDAVKEKNAKDAKRKKLIIIICVSVCSALVVGIIVAAVVIIVKKRGNKYQDITTVNTAATLI